MKRTNISGGTSVEGGKTLSNQPTCPRSSRTIALSHTPNCTLTSAKSIGESLSTVNLWE